MEVKPQRCPFVKGDMYSKRFVGQATSDPQGEMQEFYYHCYRASIFFNPMAEPAMKNGCLNGEYNQNCEVYSEAVYRQSLKIPLVCPVTERKVDDPEYYCSQTGDECELSYLLTLDAKTEEDYRSCEIFSKWFWNKQNIS